jgi:hypothetical protein
MGNSSSADAYRKEAEYLAGQSKNLLNASKEAAARGATYRAEICKQDADNYRMSMQCYNKAAARIIFDQNNSWALQRENKVDLHGLFVEEALEKLNETIRSFKWQGKNEIIVITGQGLHSQNGPKLKPAVITFARKQNIKFQENHPNPGCVRLRLERECLIIRFLLFLCAAFIWFNNLSAIDPETESRSKWK